MQKILGKTFSASVCVGPTRVDDALTELGHTLRGALVPLHLWAARNIQAIVANRTRHGS